MITKQLIAFDDDIIEIIHNNSLSKKPYLIRFTNYSDQRYEMRADDQDLIELKKILEQLISEDAS